jgi:hypothetical protein
VVSAAHLFTRLQSTAVVLFSTSVCLLSCDPSRTPQHYLVPDGFTGWAYVKYDDLSCAPLEVRDGHQILRIPASGRLCTSTRYEVGSAQDVWEYVRPDGTTHPLDRNREITQAAFHEPGHFESFLVGPARGETRDPSPFR